MNNATNSTSLIVPAALVDTANSLLEALGRGPTTFTISLYPQGTTDPDADPSHYGAHTFDDELAGIVAGRQMPPAGQGVVNGEAALLAIAVYSIHFNDGDSQVTNFNVLLNSLGLTMAIVEAQ